MPTWTTDVDWYEQRILAHTGLYDQVAKTLRQFGVSRLLEIGGGIASLADIVDRYTGVETNASIAQHVLAEKTNATMITGNWLTIDADKWIGAFDGIVALGVVEHCKGYEAFIDKCLSLKPTVVLISFFHGLSNNPDDKIKRYRSKNVVGNFYNNTYSLEKFRAFLTERSQNHIVRSYRVFNLTDKKGNVDSLVAIRPVVPRRSVKQQLERGAQFAKVLSDTILNHNGKLASQETIDARLAICAKCPWFRPDLNRCAICGCRVRVDQGFRKNLANKLAHPSSACPKGKWPAV
jgi:hypothetical protein